MIVEKTTPADLIISTHPVSGASIANRFRPCKGSHMILLPLQSEASDPFLILKPMTQRRLHLSTLFIQSDFAERDRLVAHFF